MVADPGAIAVTLPLEFTVATDVLLLDQVNVAGIGLPAGSFAVAVSVDEPPTARLSVAGETVTDAT